MISRGLFRSFSSRQFHSRPLLSSSSSWCHSKSLSLVVGGVVSSIAALSFLPSSQTVHAASSSSSTPSSAPSSSPSSSPPSSFSSSSSSPPNDLYRRCVFESLGTGAIVGLGCGSVASSKYLSSGLSLGGISLTWGLTVALSIFATRDQSGAHLNPAITSALVATGDFPVEEAPYYYAAQLAGATTAAAINYSLFSPAIRALEQNQKIIRGTAGSASIYHAAFGMIPNAAALRGFGLSALLTEILATGSLSYLVYAITDPRSNIPRDAAPLLIGSAVSVLVAVFGPLTGAGMNPARDIGPRLITLLAGWKGEALKAAPIYTVGPVIGAIGGGMLYRYLNPKEMKSLNASS